MTTPIKGNEEIRADRDAFMDAYLRAREVLGRIPGVVGVAFGRKETGGDFTTSVAILVYVREKKPDDEVPPAERIPPSFEGYRTDVRILQRASAEICDNVTPYTPIRGGIQINPVNRKATPATQPALGTLGCIVRKAGDSGDTRYLLTNAHVLFPSDDMPATDIEPEHRTGLGDHVYHPYRPRESPKREGTLVGIIEDYGLKKEEIVGARYVRADGTVRTTSFITFIDAAIARIPSGSTCCGLTCPCGEDGVAVEASLIEKNPMNMLAADAHRIRGVRDVFLDPDIAIEVNAADHGIFDATTATDVNRVFKVGRTTGVTVGIVTAVNAPVEDERQTLLTGINVIRSNLIEIALDARHPTSALGVNCKLEESFSAPGDSGSLVLDRDGNAIGLLWGGPRTLLTTPHAPGTHLPRPSKLLKYACHITAVCEKLGIEIITTQPPARADAYLPDAEGKTLFAAHAVTGGALPAATVRRDEPAHAAPARAVALRESLRRSETGRALLDDLSVLQRELVHLVRACRPVKVVWHRNEGPAFLAHVMNHVRGDGDRVPLEIEGVARATLREHMADVLAMHGSLQLAEAIARHRDAIPALAKAENIEALVEALRHEEAVGAAE